MQPAAAEPARDERSVRPAAAAVGAEVFLAARSSGREFDRRASQLLLQAARARKR
jgi:hypothetical protein